MSLHRSALALLLLTSLAHAGCGRSSSTTAPGARPYTLGGSVAGAGTAGVTLTLGGASSAVTRTDGNGKYAFAVASGSYTLTPSLAGFTFAPASATVTVNGADVSAPSFTLQHPACASGAWCQLFPSPQAAALHALWGSGDGDVWAAGDGGALLHWDGGAWSSATSGSTSPLRALWGSASGDVWAVGDSGTLLHWNGAAWSAVSSPITTPLLAAWGAASTDVWAAGQHGTLIHWNGSAWSPVASGVTADLRALWGSASGDVWAAGDGGALLHWNGTAWTAVASGVALPLHALWGSGSADVWAAGTLGTLLHWNGSAWSAASSGLPGDLYALWGSAAKDVWVAGDGGALAHYDGSGWSVTFSDATVALEALWGADSAHAWAAGAGGAVTSDSPSTAMPSGDLPGWKQIFAEDFTTPVALGAFPGSAYSTRWSPYDRGIADTSGYGTYDVSKVVSVHDGVLDSFLHTEGSAHYVNAMVARVPATGRGQLYGRYSIRMKADAIPGYKLVPLLWPDSEVWAQGEIDFPEVGVLAAGKCVQANVHLANGWKTFTSSTQIVSGWHTYTTEWSPGRLTFFIDGASVFSTSQDVPSVSMHYVLQFETAIGLGAPPSSSAGHILVDWVTMYAYAP